MLYLVQSQQRGREILCRDEGERWRDVRCSYCRFGQGMLVNLTQATKALHVQIDIYGG